jgi:hypothetical protein
MEIKMNNVVKNTVGMTPNNTMAHKFGLDDFDKQAEREGHAKKQLSIYSIYRKGKKQV